ncbi:hypothetical protein PROFUN_01758 [Planoprotostelium fungivorum]|uniref:Chromatin-remodeling ATPase INO80 n=1 Tax=Planoprotostelium fungivorum TaxID=1890364 RepID=A0A2P6MWF3_9EUKA|nr:hypothetical protein PROFUN_01758 [Planoprotostelium fungivorum]
MAVDEREEEVYESEAEDGATYERSLKRRRLNGRRPVKVPFHRYLFYVDPKKVANTYIDLESRPYEEYDQGTHLFDPDTHIFEEDVNAPLLPDEVVIKEPTPPSSEDEMMLPLQDVSDVEGLDELDGEDDGTDTSFAGSWKRMLRRELPKAHKSMCHARNVALTLSKKMANAAQKKFKERKPKQSGNSKLVLGNKGKKMVREIAAFWRKFERDEKEAKKKAEKEALEQRKREEENRETKRQQRKLNYLLTQTELFSHFVNKQKDLQVETIEGEARASSDAYDRHMKATQQFDEEAERIKNGARAVLEVRGVMEEAAKRSQAAAPPPTVGKDDFNGAGNEPTIKQPKMLQCQLKEYQLKGLSWMVNLYDQGINGILADDMGLGKTVQSIAFLSHLAEEKDIWGPFIVIAPVVTLHNWQQELSRFCPTLKVMPYWGTQKERKAIRKFWNPKYLHTPQSPFHVLITSYNLVVLDDKYLRRVKWQNMIFDEAQALKSSGSSRWKSLMSFSCRNRLLLTGTYTYGTPIQNNMAELWSLLHFIMPTLFDSHDEFNEWFSKDIENHAGGQATLDEHQLGRLRMILKPFMLRRVKKDIELEIGEKIEVELRCSLTARQRKLYKMVKEKVPIAELLKSVQHKKKSDNMSSLLNLVMQFRKVCAHPEIFERSEPVSPFNFVLEPNIDMQGNPDLLITTNRNPISFTISKSMYRGGMVSLRGISRKKWLTDKFSVFHPENVHRGSVVDGGTFGFTRLSDMSPGDVSNMSQCGLPQAFHALRTFQDLRAHQLYTRRRDLSSKLDKRSMLLLNLVEGFGAKHFRENSEFLCEISPLPLDRYQCHSSIFKHYRIDTCKATAPLIEYYCPDRSFIYERNAILEDSWEKTLLLGFTMTYWTYSREMFNRFPLVDPTPKDELSLIPAPSGSLQDVFDVKSPQPIWMPDLVKLLTDSGKMQVLDRLLLQLKREGHRVLIYSQMTKMIDILEDFMGFRKYKYYRLDGSSKLEDRRDMVNDFQASNEVFVFLLSTRAGGLGINLTAADTVIFYDSDWNPTIDEQAMDRAHRLGQTKTVTVYRLITTNTVEERILKRAKEKHRIQSLVISGNRPVAKADEVAEGLDEDEMLSFLLDEDEAKQVLSQKNDKKRRAPSKPGPKKSAAPPAAGAPVAATMKEKDADEAYEGPKKKAKSSFGLGRAPSKKKSAAGPKKKKNDD